MQAAVGESGGATSFEMRNLNCLEHALSSDSDKRVQSWIQKTQSPKILIGDMEEACEQVIWNPATGQHVPVPKSHAAICSWSCQDVCLNSSVTVWIFWGTSCVGSIGVLVWAGLVIFICSPGPFSWRQTARLINMLICSVYCIWYMMIWIWMIEWYRHRYDVWCFFGGTE